MRHAGFEKILVVTRGTTPKQFLSFFFLFSLGSFQCAALSS